MTLGAFAVIAARVVWLGVVRSDAIAAIAQDQTTLTTNIPARRGSILDAIGRRLAGDQPAVDVTANPRLIKNPARVAGLVAPIIGLPVADVEAKLRRSAGYVPLASGVAPARGAALTKMLRTTLVDGEVISGIDQQDVEVRTYPQAPRASQITGITSGDGPGIGLEERYNRVLTGSAGKRLEVKANGKTVRVLKDSPGLSGTDIRTTINPLVQGATEDTLAQTLATTRAKSVTAIVMRPQDGAILAMATAPTFDPRNRRKLNLAAVRNRAVTDRFEPGSVFKLVTMAGVLQTGLASPSTTLFVPSTLSAYDRTLGEAETRGAQAMTVARILKVSSNVGTVLLGRRLGADRFVAWAQRFGFGRTSGIDFPAEDPGRVPTPKAPDWSGVTMLNLPIGQGLSVNLLQLARAYAAVANGGYLVTPHLVARVGDRPTAIRPPKRILKPGVAAQLNAMLKGVVSDEGTGALAAVPGIVVAGKTGTANVFDTKLNYDSGRYMASFVGYAPANRPRLVVAVLVEEPKGVYYGGQVAAPAFSRIAQLSLQRLDARP